MKYSIAIEKASLWALILLFCGLQSHAQGLSVVPDKDLIDLGTAAVNTYGAQQKLEFRYATEGEYEVKFSGGDTGDFYTPSAFYYDSYSQSASAYITFHPQSTGEKRLYVVALKEGKEVRRITIKGVGIDANAPKIEIYYKSLPFEKVYIGSSKQLNMTISLSQSAAQPSMEVRGRDKDEFSISGAFQGNQSEQSVSLEFTPKTEGCKDTEFVVHYGDVEQVVPIVAEGAYQPQYIYANPETLSFPDTYIGEATQAQLKLSLVHVDKALTYTIEGEGKEFFKVQNATFEPNEATHKAVVTIDYASLSKGFFTPELVVTTARASKRIPLKAFAFERKKPTISLTPEKVDFGTVAIDSYTTTQVLLTIENTSAVPEVSLEGDSYKVFNLITTPSAGVSVYKLGFLPTAGGEYKAQLHVKVEGVEANFDVVGKCNAPSPSLVADKSELIFPDTPAEQESATLGLNLQLKYLLTDVEVTIVGDNAMEFRAQKQTIDHLSTDAYLGIAFTPKTMGDKQVTLRLSSGTTVLEIPLKGKATQKLALASLKQEEALRLELQGNELQLTPYEAGLPLAIYRPDGTTFAHLAGLPASGARFVLPRGNSYIIYYNQNCYKVIL